jgi:putative flippase GtrA
MKSFFQFGAISGVGWLLDCSLLFLFTQWLNLPVFQANFLSSVIAAVAVFSASRLLVFRSNRGQYFVRSAMYALYTCVVILIASLAMLLVLLVVRAVESHYSFSLSYADEVLFVKVFVTPPQLLANFFMARVLNTAMHVLGIRDGETVLAEAGEGGMQARQGRRMSKRRSGM